MTAHINTIKPTQCTRVLGFMCSSHQTRKISNVVKLTDGETEAQKLRQLAKIKELEKAKLKANIPLV